MENDQKTLKTAEKPKKPEEWLEFQGFENGVHPFESLAAENDPNIEKYFIPIDYFEEIEKPKTTFLFLPRGTGKSANRMLLSIRCEKTLDTSDPEVRLPITYTDFHRLIHKKNVTLRDHVDGILRELVPRLLEVGMKYNRLKDLSKNAMYDLVWFLAHYPEQLYAEAVQKQILEIKGLSDAEKQEIATKLLKLPTKFLEQYVPGVGLLSNAFETLVSTPFKPVDIPKLERSPLELMSCAYEIAKELQIDKIYIFIDRIDEYCDIHDEDKAVQLIRPMLETIPLLELPGFVFKFFLPLEYRPQLLQHLRTDRLDEFSYEWKDDDLKAILGKRLNHYCTFDDEKTRRSFARLFQKKDESIVNEIVRYADRSPRNMLKLAKRIIDEHTKKGPEGGGIEAEISDETYRRAISIFAADQIHWRSRKNEIIAQLGRLDLSQRKTVESLIEEDPRIDFKEEELSGEKIIQRWQEDHGFEYPDFTIDDVIRFLGVSKTQAQDIARQWEDAGLIQSHFKIVDKGLSTYVHTKREGAS